MSKDSETKTRKKTVAVCVSAVVAFVILVVAATYFSGVFNFLTYEVNSKNGQLSVMSFNVRCDTSQDKGRRSWDNRAELLIKSIEQAKPTILGMQEVTARQYEYLKNALTTYKSEIVYRDDTARAEGCPIFYKSDLYTLVDEGTFWLSETPEQMSRDWNSAYNRICSYVVLSDNATGKRFAVFNTHLDNASEEARVKGIGVVLEQARLLGNYPTIIMGDFNSDNASETYRVATQNFNDVKYRVFNAYTKQATYHNWGEGKDLLPIDYIMVSENGFKVNGYKVVKIDFDGAYASDHFPIISKLTLAK